MNVSSHYLGYHQPGELVMALPPGGPYAIDIIDTWEMRITPMPGKFMGVPAIKRLDKPWRWGFVSEKCNDSWRCLNAWTCGGTGI